MLALSLVLMCSIERPSTPAGKNLTGRYGFKIFSAFSKDPVQTSVPDLELDQSPRHCHVTFKSDSIKQSNAKLPPAPRGPRSAFGSLATHEDAAVRNAARSLT